MPVDTGRISHRDEMHRDHAWKRPCRVATTANITISTALNNGDTLDGITLATGDRVLVKDQTTAADNGIYVVGASPARDFDMDTAGEVLGAVVLVTNGTVNAGKLFRCTNTTAITLGTNDIAFTEISSAGGTGLTTFNYDDYGAVHDGATDDTAAIQATWDAAEAAGGGECTGPAGIYIIAGALQDTGRSNAQLLLPRRDYVDTVAVTIRLTGPTAPPTVASIIGTTPIAVDGIVFKSTLSAGTGAMIGSHGPAGTYGDFSNVHVQIENMGFRMVADPTNSCLDLSRVATVSLDDVTVDAGSYDVAAISSETTSTSFGIRLPGLDNGALTSLARVAVVGFYNGIEVGEHTTGDDVSAWACRNGAVFIAANHASHFDRFMAVWCKVGLKFSGTHYFNVDQFNIEHSASGTWTPTYDIDDASNFGKGHLAWHTVLAGTGVDHTFTVNGATGVHLMEIGDNPFAASLALDDLSDVTITSPTAADRLRYSGSAWVNSAAIWQPTMVEDGATGLWYVVVTGDGDPVMTEV